MNKDSMEFVVYLIHACDDTETSLPEIRRSWLYQRISDSAL